MPALLPGYELDPASIVSAVDGQSDPATQDAAVRIVVRRSPLSDDELDAIALLYGPADAKYGDRAFLRQLYDVAPYGGGLHAFAREGEDYVGHVSVIPLPALIGAQQVPSGKYEAFAVADAARSAASEDGVPIAVALLAAVTDTAEAQGIHLLHGMTNEQIGFLLRLAGCRRIALRDPMFSGVVDATRFADRVSGWRRLAVASAATFGGVTSAITRVGARVLFAATATIADPVGSDAATLTSGASGWTVDPTECWDWLRHVGDLRVLSIHGRRPSRILIRPPRSEDDDLHILGWCSGGAVTIGALLALAHARKLGGRAVRVQCWQPGNASAVARACRLLGFVPRPAGAFYVRSRTFDPGAVGFNPFFYAMF